MDPRPAATRLRRAARRTVGAVLAPTLTAGLLLTGPPASAAPAPASLTADAIRATPDWSGIDARAWPEPTPTTAGLLRTSAPMSAALSIPGAATATRILYSTSDSAGAPAWSTGAVFVPAGDPPAGGWPVVAWSHGTTGLGDGCTPSALPRSTRDAWYLEQWLRDGYAIVSTDYVGLGTPGTHPYLDGTVAAHNVVDSVRAARSANPALSATWLSVGQSQGAAAAVHTGRHATEYSAGHGLDFRGTIGTGTPARIEDAVQWLSPAFPPVALPEGITVYSLYILAGLRAARPDLHLDDHLTPPGRRLVDAAAELCYADLGATADGVRLGDVVTRPLNEAIPDLHGVLRAYMGTPSSGFDRPVFLGHGLLDIDVPAPFGLWLAHEMRSAGVDLTLRVYPDQDHTGALIASTPAAQAFARALR